MNLGGEFSVIFYISTLLFILCIISTITSVREEPIITTSHVDDDEERPLLSFRRKSSNVHVNGSNKHVGFVDIDSATDGRNSHDCIAERQYGDVLSNNFQIAHEVAAAQISDSDPTTIQSPEFHTGI